MKTVTEQNKAIVTRFNKEVIEGGSLAAFRELVADDVINHSAPPGTSTGADGMSHFLMDILRKGFPDIKVEIFDQIAEGDKVATRKALHGTHTGIFMGAPPTDKKVTILVTDIIRLRDGKYAEHWGMSNIPQVLAEISGKQ